MSKYLTPEGNIVERSVRGRAPKGWTKIVEKSVNEPKPAALRAVHVYSDGSRILAQRGKPKQKLENGATYVRTEKPEVEAKPRQKREPKAKKAVIHYETLEVFASINRPMSVCVYADGSEVVKGRGRCSHYNNGAAIVRLERRVPAPEHVEKRAEQKSLREDWSIEDADPNAIRGNVPRAWIDSLTPVTEPLEKGTKVWRGNSAHPGNPTFGIEAVYDGFENGEHYVLVTSDYNGKPEVLRTKAPNGLFLLP